MNIEVAERKMNTVAKWIARAILFSCITVALKQIFVLNVFLAMLGALLSTVVIVFLA